eukprot:365623_1
MTDQYNCSAPAFISRNITIGYGALYLSMLVIVSIYSFRLLMRYEVKFLESSAIKKIRIWILDVWKRRGCYVPVIAHIFDQITDISVAIQFYILAQTKHDNGNWTQCNGLNIWYLFILTILSMTIYRVISSYLIYQSTNSKRRVITQLLDLELFRALYINYLCDRNTPCDPQRWITALEAALESSPQALIQLIYLVKTNSFGNNILVLISLISSLWCIMAKLISDDTTIVIQKARRPQFKFSSKIFFNLIIGGFYSFILIIWCVLIYCVFCGICVFICYSCNICAKIWDNMEKVTLFIETKIHDRLFFVSFAYATRVIWRILDMSSHILLMTLIWITIGGTALTVKVCLECVIILAICIKTNQWEFVFSVIATVISTTSRTLTNISIGIGVYRIVSNVIWMILISVFLYVDFECKRCTEYHKRKALQDEVFIIFVYLWVSVVMTPVFMLMLLRQDVFMEESSTSRDLKKMIQSGNTDGILEIQLYNTQYGVYDESNQMTLLMLAMKQNKPSIVAFLLNKYDEYDAIDSDGNNILDHYMYYKNKKNNTLRLMKDNLLKIYKRYPELIDKENKLNGQKLYEKVKSDHDERLRRKKELEKRREKKDIFDLYKEFKVNNPNYNYRANVQMDIDASKQAIIKDHKILLLGIGNAGKSTIFKQLCQIHGNGFQQQDIDQATQNIYDCIIDQMKQLAEQCVENRENNNDDYDYILSKQVQDAVDYMLSPKIPRGGIKITSEIANLITTLWNDASIKHTFDIRANLGVVASAPHFFEDIHRIAANDYVPTDEDILLVRIPTTGIRSTSFWVDKNKFTIVDTGGERNERSKWVHQFSMVDAVLYVASLNCYDLNLFEEEDVNAMHENIWLFDLIINNRYFRSTNMILFLNKVDLFEKKIQTKSIKNCFPDYDGPDNDKECALKYITEIFISCNTDLSRQIYTHVTCATDSHNVQKVFHDVQHAVVVAALQRNGIM